MNNYYISPETAKSIDIVSDYYEYEVQKPEAPCYVDLNLRGSEKAIATFRLNWKYLVDSTKTFGKFLQVMKAMILNTAQQSTVYDLFQDLGKAIRKGNMKAIKDETVLSLFIQNQTTKWYWMASTNIQISEQKQFKAVKKSKAAEDLVDEIFSKKVIDEFKSHLTEHQNTAVFDMDKKHEDVLRVRRGLGGCGHCMKKSLISMGDVHKKEKEMMLKLYYAEFYDLNVF